MRISSNARGARTPALNALATITLVITLLLDAALAAAWVAVRRRQGINTSTVDELAVG